MGPSFWIRQKRDKRDWVFYDRVIWGIGILHRYYFIRRSRTRIVSCVRTESMKWGHLGDDDTWEEEDGFGIATRDRDPIMNGHPSGP